MGEHPDPPSFSGTTLKHICQRGPRGTEPPSHPTVALPLMPPGPDSLSRALIVLPGVTSQRNSGHSRLRVCLQRDPHGQLWWGAVGQTLGREMRVRRTERVKDRGKLEAKV